MRYGVILKHEQEKKRCYNKRVMEVEHGSLAPLVFTTAGVMGYECSRYHKALAEKLSEIKRPEVEKEPKDRPEVQLRRNISPNKSSKKYSDISKHDGFKFGLITQRTEKIYI